MKYRDYPTSGRFGFLCQTHNVKKFYPPHKHNYLEFEVLVSGKMIHELNGHRYEAQAGDFWCLQTEDIHSIVIQEPIILHNLCIDRDEAPPAVQQFLQVFDHSRTGRLLPALSTSVHGLFESLKESLCDESAYAKERVTGYALLLLSTLAEYSHSIMPTLTSKASPSISKVIRYIAANYDKPLTLSTVASIVYLTPSYFSKLFAEQTGYTFTEYVTSVRLERAKRLLADTTLPITVVAFRCGFTTFSTFSRHFLRAFGYTPSAYRNHQS